MTKILQIIPSDGWFAVYGERNEEKITKVTEIVRLMAFALVDQGALKSVQGVDSDPSGNDGLSPETETFLCYVHEHDAGFTEVSKLWRETKTPKVTVNV
jgi:hypothetical protein